MEHQVSACKGQGGWISRSTTLLLSDGWAEGVFRGRSWSGVEPLPATWYLESLIEALRAELHRIEAQELCPAQRLDELTAKVRATVGHPVAA